MTANEPLDTWSALITYLKNKLGAGYVVLPKYPEAEPDKTKRIIIVAIIKWDGKSVMGDVGNATTAYNDTDTTFRVEAWANDADGTPAQAKCLADVGTIRRYWTRAPQDVLHNVGLQPTETSDPSTLDFDGSYPGWMRAAVWLYAHKDEQG